MAAPSGRRVGEPARAAVVAGVVAAVVAAVVGGRSVGSGVLLFRDVVAVPDPVS